MTDYFASEVAFSQHAADEVLRLIRMGVVPAQFCDALGIDLSAPDRWAVEHEAFALEYEKAKIIGADAMMNYCIAIADKTDSALKADQRKLMIDARKQCAAQWNPAKYGPKADKDPPNGIQAHLHVPYDQLPADKQKQVDKFFGFDDD